MPCNACPNLFSYFAKLARKLFCTYSPTKDTNKETAIESRELEIKDKLSIANVAAYGDVRINFPQPPTTIMSDILGSEVDDFDSWNEEAEILEMESEAVSITKADHSNYTTAELDEAIFEDNPNREASSRMSRQSEKDIDSMVEFLNNSGATEVEGKYLDSTQEISKEEGDIDLDLAEADKDFRGIIEVTQTLANLSLQASTASELRPEADSSFQENCHTNIRMMINVSEPSSITTATVANFGSSEFEDSTDRSVAQLEGMNVQEAEKKSNIPDDSLESFVRTLTQVANDETQGKFSLCEEEQREEDERFTESQCTQTEELSSSSNTKEPKGQAKKRLRTKRKFRSLTRRFATESGELTTATSRRGYTVKNLQGAAGKARARTPAIGVSLFTLLQTGCCRALRGATSVVAVPVNKRKRQRRPLQLDTAMGDLVKKKQWPTNSLINTALCGSFRLVGQPTIGLRQDYKPPSAIAIPFVFGIQSTNVAPMKTGGDSERTDPNEVNANLFENSESSKSMQSSSAKSNDGKPTDPK